MFGHLADGNLHIVLNAASRDIPCEKAKAIEEVLYRDIVTIGRSFSPEHGIGTKRVGSLSATYVALSLLPATGPSATGSRRPIDLRHRPPGKAFELISLRSVGAAISENSGRPLLSAAMGSRPQFTIERPS
ncbi:FAD-linked oxidase C-terminal domain-containing protein [Ensifer canadensis]|uniref:FAD-linked oxidase C-terminal domain-containing protein n=1 Tax=Ensifer canadensis TaxID=555315 RepID=UPI0035E3F441